MEGCDPNGRHSLNESKEILWGALKETKSKGASPYKVMKLSSWVTLIRP